MHYSTLKKVRIKTGKSRKELAEAMEVSVEVYKNWEDGRTAFPNVLMEKLSDYYGIATDMLHRWDRLKNVDAYLNSRSDYLGILIKLTNMPPNDVKGLAYVYNTWDDGDDGPLVPQNNIFSSLPPEMRIDCANYILDYFLTAVELGVADENLVPLIDVEKHKRDIAKLQERVNKRGLTHTVRGTNKRHHLSMVSFLYLESLLCHIA